MRALATLASGRRSSTTRLTSFVAAIASVGGALDEALEAFADDLDAIAALIDPLALEPPIAEVFDAVRAQVDALDPATLLSRARTEVYLPITQAIAALDPRELAARLDACIHRRPGPAS